MRLYNFFLLSWFRYFCLQGKCTVELCLRVFFFFDKISCSRSSIKSLQSFLLADFDLRPGQDGHWCEGTGDSVSWRCTNASVGHFVLLLFVLCDKCGIFSLLCAVSAAQTSGIFGTAYSCGGAASTQYSFAMSNFAGGSSLSGNMMVTAQCSGALLLLLCLSIWICAGGSWTLAPSAAVSGSAFLSLASQGLFSSCFVCLDFELIFLRVQGSSRWVWALLSPTRSASLSA